MDVDFIDERLMKGAKRDGKVFCAICSSSKPFTTDGFRQHVKAIHGDQDFSKALSDSQVLMERLVIQETKNLILKVSEINKTRGMPAFDVFEFGKDDQNEKFRIHASSHRMACETLLVLLSEKGLLPHHPQPGLQIHVGNKDKEVIYSCWHSTQDHFSVVATFVKKKALLETREERDHAPAPVQERATPITLNTNDILLQTLQQVFGHSNFRNGQREIIEEIMKGRDGTVLLATGGGKTLCFTIPCILSAGLNILILPTLSLIQDMFSRLKDICSCICNSSVSSDSDLVLQNLAQNSVKILLVTPESLVDGSKLIPCLQSIDVSRLIIDEGHLLDIWGHQFRPAYLKLGEFRAKVKCQCVVFTGTATERTLDIIVKKLNMIDPFLIKHSLLRTNLYLHVVDKGSTEQICKEILKLCNDALKNQSVIIYCSTPNECDSVYNNLIEKGLKCVKYHGGDIDPFEKANNFSKWKQDKVDIIIATKSLGVGIDKSDIRSVIHTSFPSSVSDYYQQVGRCSRDLEVSHCYLFFKYSDRSVHLRHISNNEDKEAAKYAAKELDDVMNMFVDDQCLNMFMMNYFGEELNMPCNKCSVCLTPKESKDITQEAKQILLLLQGVTTRVNPTIKLLAMVFTGSKDKDIKAKSLDLLPLYNCSKLSMKSVEKIILMLLVKKVLCEQSNEQKSRSLGPGPKANDVLSGKIKVVVNVSW